MCGRVWTFKSLFSPKKVKIMEINYIYSQELSKYLDAHQPDVLRESCIVALDFVEYNLSNEFQYADSLDVISDKWLVG